METLFAAEGEPYVFTRFWLPLVGGIVAFLIVEYFVKPWMRPRLVVLYNKDESGCRIDGSWFDPPRIYIRLKVRNARRQVAKQARAFLTDVQRFDGTKFVATAYCDVLPLAWAYEHMDKEIRTDPKLDGLSLMKDTPAFVDICWTTAPSIYPTLGFTFTPTKYKELIAPNFTYRLTVQAVAEDTNPVKVCLIIKNWNGAWNHIDIYEEPPDFSNRPFTFFWSRLRFLRDAASRFCCTEPIPCHQGRKPRCRE